MGNDEHSDGNFLRRWSQRKHAAAREAAKPQGVDVRPQAGEPPHVSAAPIQPSPQPPAASAASANAAGAEAAPQLPPIDSLTFDSDFSGFLSPKVDDSLKRQALKKLFADPRFNVMDGLDVYIDDYSKFEPIPEDVLAKLEHARYIFNPPKTRVNERGEVEDVPPEQDAAQAAADPPGGESAESTTIAGTEQPAGGTGGNVEQSDADSCASADPSIPAATEPTPVARSTIPDADESRR